MSSQHKRPLIAFVTVVVLCVLLVGRAVRSEALDFSAPPSSVAGDRLRVGDRVVHDLPEETASTPPTAAVDPDPAVAELPLAATAGPLGPVVGQSPGQALDPSTTPRRSDGRGDPPAPEPTTPDEPRTVTPTPGTVAEPPQSDPPAGGSDGPDEDAPKPPSLPTEPTSTEPTTTEPTTTEPTPTEPTPTEPTPTEPTPTESSPTTPSPTESSPAPETNEQPVPAATASATPSLEDLDPIIP